MNFRQLVTTELGTRAWLALGMLPPRAGYAFACWVTRRLYSYKQGDVYRVLFDNQKHVLGPGATDEQVDAAVAAVLQHAGIANYDLVRTLSRGEQEYPKSIDLGAEFWPNLNAARATGQGVVICAAHLSNFNLGFLAFAIHGGFPIQALSTSNEAGGFKVVRELRSRGTIEDTPIDAASLRKAIVRLREGGVALTGADWPVPDAGDGVLFFDAPSLLSSGHVRLALSANAVLVPLACRWTPERGYYAMTRPHLQLERTGDREQDAQHNTHRILSILEDWIRETPDQWLMYHPVWPAEHDARSLTLDRPAL